jgi:hypothetical protein
MFDFENFVMKIMFKHFPSRLLVRLVGKWKLEKNTIQLIPKVLLCIKVTED